MDSLAGTWYRWEHDEMGTPRRAATHTYLATSSSMDGRLERDMRCAGAGREAPPPLLKHLHVQAVCQNVSRFAFAIDPGDRYFSLATPRPRRP